jgi:hypothetical protein
MKETPVARRSIRKIRIQVGGHIDLYTEDKAPEAAEWLRHQLDRVFDEYGLQLGITGMSFPGLLD